MTRKGIRNAILWLLPFFPLFFCPLGFSNPFVFNQDGDPNGTTSFNERGRFLFENGSGNTIENHANHHVCSNPAYSAANWQEMDGTRGGDTGTPSWVVGSSTEIPSLDFTRANKHYVKFDDNDTTNCTSGNDPWDHADNTMDFAMEAWVKPELSLTCSELGDKYMIISKWDGSSQCSYQVWLEAVDKDGPSCSDGDMVYRLRAQFDDSGGSFSCASPCEVEYADSTDISADEWTHITALFRPDATSSLALLLINGKYGQPEAAAATCEDSSAIADPFLIKNSTQDLFIGIDKASGTHAFEGKIGGVSIVEADQKIQVERTIIANHFDSATNSLVSPGNWFKNYLYLENGATIDTVKKRFGGGSIELDGVNDYVQNITPKAFSELDTSLSMEGLTVEAWIRPVDADGGGSREQTILSRWLLQDDVGCTRDDANSSFILKLTNAGKLEFTVLDDTNTPVTETGSTTLADNTWYHVAASVVHFGQFLTPDKLYVFVDGKSDSASPASFNNGINVSQDNFYIGNTKNSGTNSCSPPNDHFEGNIDEVMVQTWRNGTVGQKESFNPGVVINEVNYKASEEKIELYVFADLGHTLNLDDYEIAACTGGLETILLDDACGAQCSSKIVDPGDIITIVLDTTSPPADTSCNDGSAGTCTWYSGNSASADDLDAGDLADVEGLRLFNRNISTANQLFTSLIDYVAWGGLKSGCNDNATKLGRSTWQDEDFIDVDVITDNTRTIGLRVDGDNARGILDWVVKEDSIGALNSSATTAVELLSFEATIQPAGSTLLEWQTGAEFDTLGFNLLRAANAGEPKQQINTTLIQSRGSAGSGAFYTFDDFTTHGTAYLYWLEEVVHSGSKLLYGPYQSKIVSQSKAEQVQQGTDQGPVAGGPSAEGDDLAGAGSTPSTSPGCGRIVASESLAGLSLTMIMLLALFLSTRTFLIGRWFGS